MITLIKTKHGYCFIGAEVDNRLWLVYGTLERARADAKRYNVQYQERV